MIHAWNRRRSAGARDAALSHDAQPRLVGWRLEGVPVLGPEGSCGAATSSVCCRSQGGWRGVRAGRPAAPVRPVGVGKHPSLPSHTVCHTSASCCCVCVCACLQATHRHRPAPIASTDTDLCRRHRPGTPGAAAQTHVVLSKTGFATHFRTAPAVSSDGDDPRCRVDDLESRISRSVCQCGGGEFVLWNSRRKSHRRRHFDREFVCVFGVFRKNSLSQNESEFQPISTIQNLLLVKHLNCQTVSTLGDRLGVSHPLTNFLSRDRLYRTSYIYQYQSSICRVPS